MHFPLLVGSVSVDRVEFYYRYSGVNIHIYFKELMENPYFYNSFDRTSAVLCILDQFVFRNTDTNEIFQAEYAGTCTSYRANSIRINMNPRDYLRLVSDEFLDTTLETIPLEMYTADMLGAPFNLRIEPDDAIELDLRWNLIPFIRSFEFDFWIDEGILLIHFTTFIDVATVNASKLSLSLSPFYNRDANNTCTVNITGGEILNQSPGLTSSVAIKLTSDDRDLLVSKGICTGGNLSRTFIYNCYLDIESGFATAYFGVDDFFTNGFEVFNFRRAATGEQNEL